MVLVGAAIMPHASMILDPTLDDIPPGVDELHSAAKYVGDIIRELEPDVIVLATPHGLNLSDSIGIYANHVASGTAEWNGHWGDYKVSINIHDDFAVEIFNHLRASGRPCKVKASRPSATNNLPSPFFCRKGTLTAI